MQASRRATRLLWGGAGWLLCCAGESQGPLHSWALRGARGCLRARQSPVQVLGPHSRAGHLSWRDCMNTPRHPLVTNPQESLGALGFLGAPSPSQTQQGGWTDRFEAGSPQGSQLILSCDTSSYQVPNPEITHHHCPGVEAVTGARWRPLLTQLGGWAPTHCNAWVQTQAIQALQMAQASVSTLPAGHHPHSQQVMQPGSPRLLELGLRCPPSSALRPFEGSSSCGRGAGRDLAPSEALWRPAEVGRATLWLLRPGRSLPIAGIQDPGSHH